jgi:predicted HTH domain antitoxin
MEARLLDDLVAALTETAGVDPHEMRTEALRLYMNMHPTLKLDGAVALWRKNRVSLARAAEIAGLTVLEFKEILAARASPVRRRGKVRQRWTPGCVSFFHDGGHH